MATTDLHVSYLEQSNDKYGGGKKSASITKPGKVVLHNGLNSLRSIQGTKINNIKMIQSTEIKVLLVSANYLKSHSS